MRLDAPAFTLVLTMDQALSVLKSVVRRKHWRNFEAGTIKLVYIPYYVFNYTVYTKAPEEGNAVESEETGRMALNAVDASFLDLIPYIMDEEPVKLEEEPSHEYPVEAISPVITKEEAKKVISAKIAAQYHVPIDSVIVSGQTMVYLPVWRIWATVGYSTHRLDIEGVLGTIMNEERVPTREKGWKEVTMETLQDLKSPSNWPYYARTSAEFLAEKTGSTLSRFTVSGSKLLWLIFAILLLLLLYLHFFK